MEPPSLLVSPDPHHMQFKSNCIFIVEMIHAEQAAWSMATASPAWQRMVMELETSTNRSVDR